MRALVAHGHSGRGIPSRKRGRVEEARSELSAAFELFRSMEMTSWLARAEAETARAKAQRACRPAAGG